MSLVIKILFYLSKLHSENISVLYNGKSVLLEKHDPPVVYDSEETQASLLKRTCQNFEIQFLKEAVKFVRDFKSLAKEADESLDKHKTLELEIERLLEQLSRQHCKDQKVHRLGQIQKNDRGPPLIASAVKENLATRIKKLNLSKFVMVLDWFGSKHMTGNLKLLINFVWKFLGTVRFGNDHVAAILGFGDLQWEIFDHQAKAIATACYTQNRSIIHCRFNKTPYELINGRKLDISFLHVFEALCYPKNDHEDIGKLGAKAMAFEQSSSKPGLQGMTSGQISSGLDLTYAPSTITTQQPTEGELDLLFEGMYDDYIGGQPSAAPRTTLAAQAPPVLQTPTATTTTADTAPTLTTPSSQATNFPNTSQDVDELETQQRVQH
ncbi:hypothetical protein Tco_0150097 [Tanacetum coccineum]